MKRFLSSLLVAVMLLGLLPSVCLAAPVGGMDRFSRNGTYKHGTFQDVAADAWYTEGVATAYELGLMKGSGGSFSPNGSVTLAEAVTMAARLHSIYTTGKDEFVQGTPWYQVYVDYAVEHGIIIAGEFSDYTIAATRAQMAHIFAGALPDAELQGINKVSKLPDVSSGTAYSGDIFRLYRAGVLTGNDTQGTFTPNAYIDRSQAATIIARMALPELRKTLNLQSAGAKLSDAVQSLAVRREPVAPETVGTLKAYSDCYFGEKLNVSENLSQSLGLAYSLTFSDVTNFSELPAGFDPEELIDWGKYPGLNVDILHKYGFTGKGAVIAYADQALRLDHEQYGEANVHYTSNAGSGSTMHGPTVLSMLAGKDIGTAPEAEVYYYAHTGATDQANLAECLYQIIEQNKTLPGGQKITMVGFSNNIFPEDQRPNEQMLRDAVAACQAAGVMVWFCGEYSTAAFMPLSDKNNLNNLTYNPLYCNRNVELVFVPASGRTGATDLYNGEYIYWGAGGVSWTMPYVLGLYAIVNEIDPSLTQDDLRELIVDTAYINSAGMPIVNPVGFVAAALQGVGRDTEAQAMLDEVAARQKYIYAIMDTATMSSEDLDAVGSYLATLTEGTVLVADASSFSNAESLYSALQADAAVRGGTVVGVQIFGTADMVPTFQVKDRVQMPNAVHETGYFLTDLFYSNFNNDPQTIANGYNVMDHFALGWDVDLIPDWPVARLPLEKGEFAAFFEKYEKFALDTGLEQQDIVNFSNPIFASTKHYDDMGTFLKRMDNEFGLLDVDYRLYGNLDGQYPVTNKVLGGFTKENLSKENEAGVMELLINTHGQRNNIDQCIFINGEEQRISFLNIEDINAVLADNPYYLDCWTCLNGYGMKDNLTTTALNGQCVGVFSATTTISNNGARNYATLEEMQKSNFYYFYYNYLKALHDGQSRSQAFYLAQRAYAEAVIAHSAEGLQGYTNYQFNLSNLLAYHNFGVLEPNAAAMALHNRTGYIAQAGQSVPKNTASSGNQGGGSVSQFALTNGNPVGTVKSLKWLDNNMLQSGSYTIHSYTAQELDNGYIRFTIEYTAPKGLRMVVFNPPDGDVFKLFCSHSIGSRESQTFDLKAADVRSVNTVNISFSSGDNNRFFVSINTSGL